MRISDWSSDVCSSDLYRRQHEGAGPEVDARVEAVEPIPHRPPGDRPGDEVGYDDGLGELPGEQPHDVAAAGAHHLADADLLSPALGGEGGEAEQAEAGDDHRPQGKSREGRGAGAPGSIQPAHKL